MRLWALGQLDTDLRPNQADRPQESDDNDPDELDQAAAALGLQIVGPRPGVKRLWLWPETIPLWNAWHQVQTQWRWIAGMSAAHRVGLDYAGVERWLAAHGWGHRKGRSLRGALDAIAQAERAALKAWAEIAAKEKS